jgi:hypothetical protein
MIKYLNSRICPSCRSSVTTMLLRYSSKLSAISGVCSGCDYSMKWLILGGNLSMPGNMAHTHPEIARRSLKTGSDKKVEVLSS